MVAVPAPPPAVPVPVGETSMCDLSESMLSIYLNFCSVGEKSLSNGSQMGHGARWGGVSIKIRKYDWENRAGNYLLDI